MTERKSTNAKLADIINSKQQDREEEMAFMKEESKAKLRLRRTVLYGVGARCKIPKVKKGKKADFSPFSMTGQTYDELMKPKPLESSVPPGAHNDAYRIVTNLTRRSMNDPDRICINSSSMLEGVHSQNQPPWYVGNNNKVVSSDSTLFMAASRYGYRGANKMQQYNTERYQVPSKTHNENTPHFLRTNSFIDEWTPPILATKYQTINSIETPKLWPENTEYVTGYQKKKDNISSWIYKRETTVHLPERPKSSDVLHTIMETMNNQDKLLRDYAKMESTGKQLSLPMTQKLDFDTKWNEKVQKTANSTLRSTLSLQKPIYEAHTLMDPSDTMRYSGSTAMIVHTQSTDELKFRLRMDESRTKASTPYELRWHHVIAHFRNLQNKLKRGQSIGDAIREVANLFQQTAIANGSETSLRRADFVQACRKTNLFEETTDRQISSLYSAFDPMKRNALRYVEIITAFMILYKPELSPYDKLKNLWKSNIIFGYDRSPFDIALDILTSCSLSAVERSDIEEVFTSEFRKKCYEMSLDDIGTEGRKKYSAVAGMDDDMGSLGSSSLFGKSSPMNKGNNNQSNIPPPINVNSNVAPLVIPSPMSRPTTADFNQLESNSSKKSIPKLPVGQSVQPQYNISENYLNHRTFVRVIKCCNTLHHLFEKQLSAITSLCYGYDVRIQKELLDKEENEEHEYDFRWILSPKSNASEQKRRQKKELTQLQFTN